MKDLKFSIKRFIFLLLLIPIFSSCVRNRNLIYFQNSSRQFEESLKISEYRIRPGDDLKIEFTSTDPSTSALLNRESGLNASPQLNNISIFVSSYRVDSLGFIEIPLLKRLSLAGLTLTTAEGKISQELTPVLKLKNVTVKMANGRVSVLGEVKNPGTFYLYNDRTTLLQALSLAGDMTDMGNRHRIKIVRNNTENKRCTVSVLDITKPESIASEYYYVYPNDVIYVEPCKAKSSRINLPVIQASLTGFTAILLLINVLLKI